MVHTLCSTVSVYAQIERVFSETSTQHAHLLLSATCRTSPDKPQASSLPIQEPSEPPMSAIRQVIPLARQGPWRTQDPYLFCVHHLDNYPAGNSELGPSKELLRGRHIGSDFSGTDGWSMYHGSNVPGFPQHPHRGFETITFVRSGTIDHSDSLGATARYCTLTSSQRLPLLVDPSLPV